MTQGSPASSSQRSVGFEEQATLVRSAVGQPQPVPRKVNASME